MKHENTSNHYRKSYVLYRVRQALTEQDVSSDRLEHGRYPVPHAVDIQNVADT